MSSQRLLERAPSATFFAIATLKEHRLQFHKISRDGSGKCDAVHTADQNDCVMGVIFEMSASDKKKLDQKECQGFGYQEKTVTVMLENGEQIEASTYCTPQVGTLTGHKLRLRRGIKKNGVATDATLRPYSWYKEHVLRGAREYNLPHDYISIIKKIKSLPDPDMDRHEQELAIYI